MRPLIIGLLMGILVGCKSAQPVTSSGGDGSSFEQALIVQASHEKEGITAEYRWLHEHYPGHKRRAQSLLFSRGHPYDRLDIVTADGQSRSVYFDITSFFGK